MINENSLYVDNGIAQKDLLRNKTKVMDILIFNYFGFIALLGTKPSDKGMLKTYKNKDAITTVDKIDPTNSDIMVAIKLAVDADIIDNLLGERMLSLFNKMRTGMINPGNFDNDSLINLLIKTRYQTNKPSPKLLGIIEDYISGKNLNKLLLDLVDEASSSVFKAITTEFRQITKLALKYTDNNPTPTDDAQHPQILAKGTIARAQQIAHEIDNDPEHYKQSTFNKGLKTAWDENKSELNTIKQFEHFYNLTSATDMENFVKENPLFDHAKFMNWLAGNYLKIEFPSNNTNALYTYLFSLYKKERKGYFTEIGQLIHDKILYYSQNKGVGDILADFEQVKLSRDVIDDDISTAMTTVADLMLEHLVELYKSATPAKFKELKIYTGRCIQLLRNYGTSIHRRLGDVLAQLLKGMGRNRNIAVDEARAFVMMYSSGVIYIDVQSGKYNQYLVEFLNYYFEYDLLYTVKRFDIGIYESLYNLISTDQQALLDILVQSGEYKIQLVDVPEYQRLKETFDKYIAGKYPEDIMIKSLRSFGNLVDEDYTKFVGDSRRYIKTSHEKILGLYSNVRNSHNDPIAKTVITRIYSDLFGSFKAEPLPGVTDNYYIMTTIIESMAYMGELENNYSILNGIFQSTDIVDLYSMSDYLSNESKSKFYFWVNKYSMGKQDFQHRIITGSSRSLYGFVDSIAMRSDTFVLEYIDTAYRFLLTVIDIYTYNYRTDAQDLYVYVNKLYDKHPTLRSMFIDTIIKDTSYEMIRKSFGFFTDKIFSLVLNNKDGELDDSTYEYLVSYVRDNLSNLPPMGYFKDAGNILEMIRSETKSQILSKMKDAPGESLDLLSGSSCDIVLLNEILESVDITSSYANFMKLSAESFSTKFHKLLNKVLENKESINSNTAHNLMKAINYLETNKTLLKISERNSMQNLFFEVANKMYSKDPESVDDIFDGLSTRVQKNMLKYFYRYGFLDAALTSIVSDANPIKPKIKVDRDKIANILTINRIEPPGVDSIEYKKGMKLSVILKEGGILSNDVISDLKISPVTKTPWELEESTIEYDRKFNSKLHSGQYSYLFLDEYDVKIPEQIEGINKFIKENPDTEIMDIAFHGTGTVAASMILRYGFRVMTAQMAHDAGVAFAGRMLGDGVYFADKIDKAGQYASDGGFRNQNKVEDPEGFIFIMKAALGTKGKHHSSSIKGKGNSIVNNEWCVFFPNEQLMIYKAYRIKAIRPGTYGRIVAKHQLKENYVGYTTFSTFLKEEEAVKQDILDVASTNNVKLGDDVGTIKLIFTDGSVPISTELTTDMENITVNPLKANLEITLRGAELTIFANGNVNDLHEIPFTKTFMVQNPQLLNLVLNVINKKD